MYLQSNTGNKIARILDRSPGASIDFIVREVWPKTKQPDKKARTVQKYIRGIERERSQREAFWQNYRKYSEFPRLAR